MFWITLAWAATVDPLALAARLVADGHHARASTVLAQLEPPAETSAKKGTEASRYHTLVGLVALELGDAQRAADAFEHAATLAPEPLTWLGLAGARDQLGQPTAALAALDAGGPALDGFPTAWLLRSRGLSALQRPDDAYGVALEGAERFPADADLVAARFTLAIERGLTHQVAIDAPAALIAAEAPEELWLELAQGLLIVPGDAQVFAEQARLALPHSHRARLVLASACLAQERYHCAGSVLAEAAAFDATYALQASEAFRRAGELQRALYLNGQVADPADKARQRLSLLVELQAWDEAAALDARLERLGLLQDDSVAYALAYAHAIAGDLARAEVLVTRLSDPALADQGAALLATLGETP